MSTMEFHAAAKIFPLDESNIDSLAEDIRKNGQTVPIEVCEGRIIDGRRRSLACERLGVKPQTREVNVEDPVAYVLSLNLHRRHLTETQRALIGARAKKLYEKQAKERQRIRKGNQPGATVANLPQLSGNSRTAAGKARDAAGKAVGVSGKSIDYATKLLNSGTAKLIAAADADKVAISTAARMSALPAAEQDKFAEAATGKRRTIRKNEVLEPEREPDGKIKGVGVIRANEAINCLIRIPKNDALRRRGLQIVFDWIKANR